MKCPNPHCNANNKQDANFCHICGTRLINNETTIRPREVQLEGRIRVPRRELSDPFGTPPRGVEAINLGLPSGTRWASCNVGATRPEEYGGLYAWGETEERNTCDWSTYSRCGGSEDTCFDLGRNIAGTKFDVARTKWGGRWQIPSCKQIEELQDRCTFERTSLNNIKGVRCFSPNNNSIFLPDGSYWLSDPEGTSCAHFFTIGEEGFNILSSRQGSVKVRTFRYGLKYIRPVIR